MSNANGYLAEDLQKARETGKLSQRELSRKAGVPQGQISKIENAAVDPKVSTLVKLARALGYEVMLVPRQHLVAVKSLARSAADSSPSRPRYALDDESDG